MKERPILFSAPMVRAILAGTKTQTRRVVKPQPYVDAMGNACWNGLNFGQDGLGKPLFSSLASPLPSSKTGRVRCPYGAPGDRLWVREAWARTAVFPGTELVVYRESDSRTDYGGPWKPGIHMFRRDSRIALEVTGVRVERLQDISEADAKAEGCERLYDDEPGYVERYEPDWNLCPQCGGTRLYTSFGAGMGALPDTDCLKCDTYAKRYRHLWESINGRGSWDANPWVWVVEFTRIEAAWLAHPSYAPRALCAWPALFGDTAGRSGAFFGC